MEFGEQLALAAAFVWSVAVILIRISGLVIAPLPLTLFKSALAVVFFALTIPFLKTPMMPELSSKEWIQLAVSAVLGISVADTMVVAALKKLGASLHAIADCLYVPSMALVGYFLLDQSLTPWEVFGGVLVVAGVAVGMRLTDEVTDPKTLVSGVLLAGGAHVIMAIGILMVRDIYAAHSVVWVSGVRFLMATIALVFYGLSLGPEGQMWEGFRRRDMWKWMVPMSFLGPFMTTLFWASGFVYAKAGRAALLLSLIHI